jgi:hypothetical protein
MNKWGVHCYTFVSNSLSCVVAFVVKLHTHTQNIQGMYNRNFSLTSSFQPHYGPGVISASNRNEDQGYLQGTGGLCVGLTDNLTTFMCQLSMTFWKPTPTGTQQTCAALHLYVRHPQLACAVNGQVWNSHVFLEPALVQLILLHIWHHKIVTTSISPLMTILLTNVHPEFQEIHVSNLQMPWTILLELWWYHWVPSL